MPTEAVVDLRSDTVTRPTAAMWEAMRAAPLGDDVLGDEPTVAALEKAGLTYKDIEPVYLAPADGAAAFAKGAVDAWTIWDPNTTSGAPALARSRARS